MRDDDPLPDAAWFDEFAAFGAWESEGYPMPPRGWPHGIMAWHDTVHGMVKANRLRQGLKAAALAGRDLARDEAAARYEAAAADPLFFGPEIDEALERIANRTEVEDAGDGDDRDAGGTGESEGGGRVLPPLPAEGEHQPPLALHALLPDAGNPGEVPDAAEEAGGVPALRPGEAEPAARPLLPVFRQPDGPVALPEHEQVRPEGVGDRERRRPAA